MPNPTSVLRFVVLTVSILATVGTACSGDSESTIDDETVADRVLRGADRYDSEGLVVVNADLNGDGLSDVYSIYKEEPAEEEGAPPSRRIVRKEVDVNFDGGIDIWRHYNEAEKLAKEELDYNFDGRVDAVSFFDRGRLIRKEIDVEFDQAPDVFKHYKDGVLVRIERDSNSDGKVDYWEYYERGVLDRIGKDDDGDGRVDSWTER